MLAAARDISFKRRCHLHRDDSYQKSSWASLDEDAAAAAAAAAAATAAADDDEDDDDAPGGQSGWPGATVQSSSWCRGLAS